MGRPITFTDFMKRLSTKTKLREKTVRRVYDDLFELVSEELRFADEIKLKRFGTFTTKQQGGKDKNVPTPDGSLRRVYIEPYVTIKFRPSAEFINYVNGRLVDKDSKKRERKGLLTKNEKALLSYTTKDNERNLDIALEKFAEEVKSGKR